MAEFPTKRIINLDEQSEPQSGDYIVTDNQTSGTKKTPASALAKAADLTAEQTARAAADTTLDGKITAEAQARAEAISGEQTAREEADDALTESITALSGKVDEQGELIQNPTKTVSGSIAHFTDGADMPAKSVIVNIEPKQSGTGTPSPDNVRPISGWESVNVNVTGVNVWDEEWESGYITPSTGAEVADANKIRMKNYIPVLPNTMYYKKTPTGFWNVYFDADKNYISYGDAGQGVFTTPSNAFYLRSGFEGTYGATYNNDISINYPSTDHEYHAYNPNSSTTTIPFGQTVYGGPVDIVSGSGIADRKYKLLNGSEYNWYDYEYAGVKSFRFIPNDMASVQSREGVVITNEFTFKNAAWGYGEDYGTFSGSGTSIYFRPPNAEITTLAEFRAWLASNPLQVVYPLAQPVTYQLTPTQINTLLGENNVWADAGAVEVTYRRDINLALEQLEALLNGTETATAQPTASTAETSEA